MGFFEDTKPSAPVTVVQEVKHGWFAVLIGGFFAILGMFLSGAGRVAWAILKPYIAWCMNIEGKSRKETLGRLSCLVLPIMIAIFWVFQIPTVWDFVSLSESRTMNHTQDGYRIFFPDRSFFTVSEARHIVHNDGSRVYIAYTGYTKDVMQKVDAGQCQLVPRSRKMGFASVQPPIRAEGFKNEVVYTISLKVSDLSWWELVLYKLREDRPNLFKGKAYFEYSTIEREHVSSWKGFVDNWNSVWSPSNMHGYKPFEVRALWNEHAIACF